MGLIREVTHPARRHYVLKLDRSADPAHGSLSGRVENLATGRQFDFTDLASLMEGLTRELDISEARRPNQTP